MRAQDRLGRKGESLAADYLEQRGVVVITRNWRCSDGELDIIAADDDTLVICEVKTRSSVRYGTPLEAVDEFKLHRMQRLAFAWCREQRIHPPRLRFDVIEVLAPRLGDPVITHHVGVV